MVHPPAKLRLLLGLVFDVHQEKGGFPLELAFGHQIHLVPLALLRQVEDLFVEELDRLFIQVLGGLGQESIDKIAKELPQQFLEQLVMVDWIAGGQEAHYGSRRPE